MTRFSPPPVSPWRHGALALAVGATLAFAATSCSSAGEAGEAGSPDGGRTATTTTNAVVEGGEPTSTTSADGGSGTSAPAGSSATSPSTTSRRAVATTSLLPAGTDVPDDPPPNSKGVPITLDETALLACAQNQFAWVARNEQRPADAAAALRIAAERAGASSVAAIAERAAGLAAAADGRDTDATVSAFLDLCETNGFEY